MLPYFILMFLPLAVSLIQHDGVITVNPQRLRNPRRMPTDAFFLVLLLLLLIRGLDCGVDVRTYLKNFQIMSDSELSQALATDREHGYRFLLWCLSQITGNFRWVLVLAALLAVIPLWRFYRDEAEMQAMTLVLFLTIAPYNMYFSGLQQTMAMAFAFPAWRCARNGKWVSFLLLVLLAMQFHISAFMLLALYPLYHLRITRRWLIFIIPLMIVVYRYNDVIFNFLSVLLWKSYGEAGNTGATTVLLLLILFAAYAFILPEDSKLDKEIIALRNVLLCAIFIQCFAPVHSLAMRMNYYFLTFVPILIPKIANRCKAEFRDVRNVSLVVMMLFFMAYYFLRAYTGTDILEIYPYIPFWKN